MKNIKLLLLVVLALNFAACKKFLDEKPITQVDETFVFSDVVNTRKAIAGVYSQLTGDQGYGIRLSLYFTVDNDETQGPSGNPTGDNDRRDISRYKATPSNAQIERPFNQLFKGIEFANNCIEGIPKSPVYTSGSEKEKKQMQRMLGEALTLRAQFYFEAIRNWGDLPEHFGSAAAQAQGDAFPKRVNRDIIYDRIIEDLKTAASLMPWRSEVSSIGDDIDERITKGTAKALRARIALFRAGYSLRNDTKLMQQGDDANKFYNIARTECKEIMDAGEHSLNPSFKSLWKDQVCAKVITDPNGELMFQVSGIGAGAKADTKLGYYNGPSVNSKGNRSVNILPTYFYQFDSSDLRRDVTCAPYSVLADGVSKTGLAATAIVDGKYRRDWITPAVPPTSDVQYFGLKWQIIRYSDVLLMFAEAENELSGPTAAAYDAINAVRRRGFGVNASTPGIDIPAGLGKLDFFKYLVKERSLEFGGEGIRKYDLIRWNLLEKALNESKQNLTALANSTNLVNPTYMAGYPTYVLDNKLPRNMFFKTNTKSDDNTTQGIWMNSFYNYSPFADPNVSYPSFSTDYTINNGEYETAYVKGRTNVVTLPDLASNIGNIYWVKLAPTNAAATTTSAWSYNMKVNAAGTDKIDGTLSSVSYSGSVAAANPAATSGSSRTIGFMATANGWVSGISVNWLSTSIQSTILTDRYASGFQTNKSELLPIPLVSINANFNLTQNPNY